MQTPEIPENEATRLIALDSYDILDTAAEVNFDALTRLAAHILDVPIALVSLIDRDRQWFKSHHGLSVTETPRDISFCGHVVATGESLAVPNASEDPRFHDNPLATGGPRVQFYIGMPLKTGDGHVLGTLCAIDNIPRQVSDEQKELLGLLADQVMAQLELRKAARQMRRQSIEMANQARELRTVFAIMGEGVVKQINDGTIVECNPAAESILGLTTDQMMGRKSVDPSWQSVHEDGSPFPGNTHPAMMALSTGQSQHNVIMGVHKPNGALTWININAEPMFHADVLKGVVTTFRDITDERAQVAEQEILRQQIASRERLVTAGTLAAGVAHEVNNPLSYILSNIDYALEQFNDTPPADNDIVPALVDARAGAILIRDVVGGLRTFAREEVCVRPTDPTAVIKIAINLATHEMKRTATWKFVDSVTSPVVADDSLLAQVLVNLLVNAARSFSEVQESNLIIISLESTDDSTTIIVKDNGSGIAPDVLPQIFDPFFTTHPVGSGTGLGLSVARGIVTSFGGKLTCESTLGAGSTFRVILQHANYTNLSSEETLADED